MAVNPNMNEMKDMLIKMASDNKMYVILFFTFIVILVIILYVSNKLNLKDLNCSKLKNSSNSSIISISNPISTHNKYINETLNKFFIKTAYNCCCSGQFKNDYVDICALKNCASYGVRALDFQIYSLNKKPIVSASSIESTRYKEIYNSIGFYNAIHAVRKYFVDDQSNQNRKDHLFLIFRLYTINAEIYDMMAQALDQVYGYASPLSNMIYTLPSNVELANVKLSDLIQKVVIIVDTSYGDANAFENSKLNNYASMVTGKSITQQLYREKDLLSRVYMSNSTVSNEYISNSLTILYPDIQQNKINYDSITSGIFNNVSFIGMNFQSSDKYLLDYNNIFSKSGILYKQKTLQDMCIKNEYKSTNICTVVNKQPPV